MQRLVIIFSAVALLGASFFGTLYVLNSLNFELVDLDKVRIEQIKSLKIAIEAYRAARGMYPSPFHDNDLADLTPELVGGGFIAELPRDPYWKTSKLNRYRYRSNGTSYGLLLRFELFSCQTGVGAYASVEWLAEKVPPCAF
jgi:hypothetical protein